MGITPLVQTLIGAGAAIVGGLVAGRWQSKAAAKIAKSIRREEREEEVLLDLRGYLTYVGTGLGNLIEKHVEPPPRWVNWRSDVDQMVQHWYEQWAGRVYSGQMRTLFDAMEAAYKPIRAAIEGEPSERDFWQCAAELRRAVGTLHARIEDAYLRGE